MKKLLILFIIFTLFLSGCGIFNLDGWILPDDAEFLACIQLLNNPEKICQYMLDNFDYKKHFFYAPNPYNLWSIQEGDCNDFSCFAVFVANHHEIEAYQIRLYFSLLHSHIFPVFKEGYKYSFIDSYEYFPPQYNNFIEMAEEVCQYFDCVCTHYKVYDYDMNIVEQSTK